VLRVLCPYHVLPGLPRAWCRCRMRPRRWPRPLLLGTGSPSKQPHARARRLRRARWQNGAPARMGGRQMPPCRSRRWMSTPARCERIRDTLTRLGLQAQVLAADAGRPQDWWLRNAVGSCLMPSCWTRRAPPRASCAATRMCAGCAARAILRSWPLFQAHLLARCGRCCVRAGACCTAPARCSGPRGSIRCKRFLHATPMPAAAFPGPFVAWHGHKGETVPDNLSGEHDGFFYALLHKAPV
jgi:hypothetical protein